MDHVVYEEGTLSEVNGGDELEMLLTAHEDARQCVIVRHCGCVHVLTR